MSLLRLILNLTRLKLKGIILAAGKSTRLFPITKVFSKHFLPIFDKPMIYYPLSILLLAGIDEVLIITNPKELNMFEDLLGDGKSLGVSIVYETQSEPRGIADAFIIGEDFIGSDSVCLILGDNIIYGQDLTRILNLAKSITNYALIFGYHVSDPSSFGVVEFNGNFDVISLEEKPISPKSNYAVPGIYFYPNNVVEIAKSIQPSSRGEIEITSINNRYLEMNKLIALPLGRGMAWLDTGNPESLINASNFVEVIQKRQGFYIGCIEEIAWRKGFITLENLLLIGEKLKHTAYGKYLLKLGEMQS
jgi:glucose-1-phosphate thymidylyltransferase